MRTLCALSYFLFMMLPLQASVVKPYEKLKIYDSGEFKQTTYYNGMVSTNTLRTDFLGRGHLLTSSTLAGSTARIIDCPKSVNARVREKIWQTQGKRGELSFQDLAISQCIRIDYKEAKVYFVEFEYRVSLVNAKYADQKGIPVIWVGMEDKDGLKDVALFYSDHSIRGDSYMRADLAGVADVNRDGKHEIVIDHVLYAGRHYKVFGCEGGKMVNKEIFGDAWD